MSFHAAEPEGATPLSEEDLRGLKQSWVTTQGELNQLEAENILRARLWSPRSSRARFWFLDDAGLKTIHRRMFDEV